MHFSDKTFLDEFLVSRKCLRISFIESSGKLKLFFERMYFRECVFERMLGHFFSKIHAVLRDLLRFYLQIISFQ